MPEPKKTDAAAPKFLELTITGPDGAFWGKIVAQEKSSPRARSATIATQK